MRMHIGARETQGSEEIFSGRWTEGTLLLGEVHVDATPKNDPIQSHGGRETKV